MRTPFLLGGLAAVSILAACAANGEPVATGMAPAEQAARRAFLAEPGYLPKGSVPDSLTLNPPPPAPGSAALARDEEAARATFALRGSPRWEQAAIDADLFTPKAADVFSCAAGLPIGPDTTPRTQAVLNRVGRDLAMSVYPTKTHYKRPRPFIVNGEPTCTPRDEAMLRGDGSYPSGHSALGYGWGLILAEIVPDRAAALVARGRAFGDSRRVCNVHWLSDIEEGRVVATAVFARLHAEPTFLADVQAAREEVAAAKARIPAPDCARENAALAGK